VRGAAVRIDMGFVDASPVLRARQNPCGLTEILRATAGMDVVLVTPPMSE